MIPVNRVRYHLLVTIWPLCLAFYLLTQALFGSGGDRHPLADFWFDLFSFFVVGALLVSSVFHRVLILRMFCGVGMVGLVMARSIWLLDPSFVPSQHLLAASIFMLIAVSSLGWVMAADFAVVSTRMQQEDHGG